MDLYKIGVPSARVSGRSSSSAKDGERQAFPFQHVLVVAVMLLLVFSYPLFFFVYIRTPSPFHDSSVAGSQDEAYSINSLTCGSLWRESYAEMHKHAMAAGKGLFERSGSRFVIYDCIEHDQARDLCGGLGDMIVGIVSTFAFALLSNRTFLIRAPVIEAAFHSPYIDWRIPRQLSTQSPWFSNNEWDRVAHYKLHDHIAVTSINAAHAGGNATASLLVTALSDPAHIIAHRGGCGIIHSLLTEKDAGVASHMSRLGFKSPSEAFGCLLQHILRPSSLVTDAIRSYLHTLQPHRYFVIGIHVRTGDGGMLKNASKLDRDGAAQLREYGQLFECAQAVTRDHEAASAENEREKRAVWFLSSDSMALKEEAKKLYGSRIIISTDFMPEHLSQRREAPGEVTAALASIVGEWVLFSHCHISIFRASGWATTAALASPHSHHTAFVFPRDRRKWGPDFHALCDPKAPVPLDAHADEWSGI